MIITSLIKNNIFRQDDTFMVQLFPDTFMSSQYNPDNILGNILWNNLISLDNYF